MSDIEVAIKVKNYRCFRETAEGFELIKPINVIIGRNNSGKSALMDLAQESCKQIPNLPMESPARDARIVYSREISEDILGTIFKKDHSGGPLRDNWWTVGKKYKNAKITWEHQNRTDPNEVEVTKVSVDLAHCYVDAGHHKQFEKQIAQRMNMARPLVERPFLRISAERDVRPEKSTPTIHLEPNGTHATNLVQHFLNVETAD